jgi:hypothetical protein
MYINKAKDSFMMLDIKPDEMATIYDAFNSGHYNFLAMLKMEDEELMKTINCKKEAVPQMRIEIQKKIDYYIKWIKKLQSYVSS